MTMPDTHWKSRLFVCLTMLILAFIGLILGSIKSIANFQTWHYWLAIGPIFAVLTIWLSWHLRKQDIKLKGISLWYDCWHWIALVGAIFILHVFVLSGILGRFEAGFVALDLLALACFTSGIYFDTSLIFVGVTLALMALLVSLITQYITVILVIVLLVGAIALYVKLHLHHRKKTGA